MLLLPCSPTGPHKSLCLIYRTSVTTLESSLAFRELQSAVFTSDSVLTTAGWGNDQWLCCTACGTALGLGYRRASASPALVLGSEKEPTPLPLLSAPKQNHAKGNGLPLPPCPSDLQFFLIITIIINLSYYFGINFVIQLTLRFLIADYRKSFFQIK